MITFSLRPLMKSERPWIAASVSTRVVSWNEAADSHESVAREALVIPMSSGRPSAGRLPSVTSSLLASRKSLVVDQSRREEVGVARGRPPGPSATSV